MRVSATVYGEMMEIFVKICKARGIITTLSAPRVGGIAKAVLYDMI